MKSLVRWTTTLGLIGATVMGSALSFTTQVLALTDDEIVEKLQSAVAYTIADGNLTPLVASVPAEGGSGGAAKNVEVMGIFISRQDAEAFLNRLKTDNPQVGNQTRVIPIFLSDVYQLAMEQKDNPQPVAFRFIPTKSQTDAAASILRQSGQESNPDAVPLFAVRYGPNKGLIPMSFKQGEPEVIPLFFSAQEAQSVLNVVKQKQPEADIQVLSIDGVLQELRSKNDEWLEKVVFVMTPESRQYVQSQEFKNFVQSVQQQR